MAAGLLGVREHEGRRSDDAADEAHGAGRATCTLRRTSSHLQPPNWRYDMTDSKTIRRPQRGASARAGTTFRCTRAAWRMTALAFAFMLTATASGQGGNIYLTGHDILLHSGQAGYDLVILDYLRSAGLPNEILAADYEIAVIGSEFNGFWQWSNFTTAFPTGYPPVVFIDADANTSVALWEADLGVFGGAALFDCIVVLSHESCGGCSMTTMGSNNLNDAQLLIQNLFNSDGMDVWANAGANLPTYYNFLPAGFLSTAPPVGGFTFCATPEGLAQGLTCAMTAGFPTHNQFVGFSPVLDVWEQECTGNPPLCGSPATGAVISVAAQKITLGCMDVVPEEILCVLDDSGCVDYTFTITNNSGVVAEYLLFPSDDIEPNVIDLDSVPGDGGMATVTITICGAPPGEEYCFDMILADAAFEECCPAREHCVDIPLCDCGQVHTESFECTDDGNFVYTFTLDNLFAGDIYHTFLVDLPDGVTADPDYFDLVALGGQVPQFGSIVLSTTISGATAGEEICFRVTTHIESLEECCAFDVCITAPDCCPACPGRLQWRQQRRLFADLLILISEWGQSGVQSDIDCNRIVDFEDLLLLLCAWCPS